MKLPDGYTWDLGLKMSAETTRLMKMVWPNFILEESDLPGEPPRQARMSLEELRRRMPLWGIRHNGELVTYASGVLIEADREARELSDRGWTWAMETFFGNSQMNCLCLLAANVDPAHRGQGLAEALLQKGKEVARANGLKAMIGPVRPTEKDQFPEMSFADYIQLRREDGALHDPWLRLHARLGAEILNICRESVVVKASLARWQQWTGHTFTASGLYSFPQGLAPLDVDLPSSVGVYREPNVWVRYSI